MSNQAVLPAVGTDPGQRVCCTPLTRAPLGETEAAELTHVLKAVADPVRLRLLSLIGAHDGGEACVCDLTAAFDLTGPTISHHLKVLREAGVVSGERRGTWIYYRLEPKAASRISALGHLLTAGAAREPKRVTAKPVAARA